MKIRDYIVIFTLFLILMTFGGCTGCNNSSVYNKAYSVGYEDCKAGRMKKWYPIIYDFPNMLFAPAPDKEDQEPMKSFSLPDGEYRIKVKGDCVNINGE